MLVGIFTENLSARGVLGHNVDHVLRGHDLVQLDHVRVVQELEDLHLTVDFLQVGLVQLRFVDDFDGHLGKI